MPARAPARPLRPLGALLLGLALACSERATPAASSGGVGGVGGSETPSGGSVVGVGEGGGTEGGVVSGGVFGEGAAPGCALAPAPSAELNHPGGLHKRSDLQRMRQQVAAGVEPWKTSFERLKSDARASADYVVRGDPTWTTLERGGLHGAEYESDATAAYLNALMWAVTEDEAHARKSIEIFNAWKNLTAFVPSGTPSLDAGLLAYKLVEAAELIRWTYDGWSVADVEEFSAMLVRPRYSSTELPAELSPTNGTFYWRIYNGDPGRHGNQDLVAWRAMLTLGVFLDNRLMYERALRYFKGLPHLPEDLPYAAGPATSGAQLSDNEYVTTFQPKVASTVPDYGYNGVLEHYIWENGQCQESSRDQQHALFGLGLAAGLAEVAWNQGDAVWNLLDDRLLKGFEFAARYNVSYLQSYPDQAEPWEPSGSEVIVRTDRTGRFRSKAVNPYFDSDFTRLSRGDFPGKRPVFEQALAHFAIRRGLSDDATKWTRRATEVARERYGEEPNGFSLDHPGWGGLTFRRPPGCAGDPIRSFDSGRPVFALHDVPGVIPAANYDHFPESGEGHTFHDASPGNSGQHYRRDDVDVTCSDEGPILTDLEAGEWLTYTLGVPSAGAYVVELRYRAGAAGAALRVAVGDAEPSEAASLPDSASVWATSQIATLDLRAGVHALRLLVDVSSAGLQLSSLTLRSP